MNNIYRVIYNKSTKAFQAVCEYARAQGKSSTTTVGSAKPDIIGRAFRLSTLVMSLIMAQGAWAQVITADKIDFITIGGRDIGFYAEDNQDRAIFGKASKAELDGTAVGNTAEASGAKSTAVGSYAKTVVTDGFQPTEAVALGYKATASYSNSTAIASNARANGQDSIAMGNGAQTGMFTSQTIRGQVLFTPADPADAAIAIGKDSTASNNNDIAIGQEAGKNLRPRGADITNNTPDGTTIAFNGQSMPVATAEAIAKAFGNNQNQQAVNNLNPATSANISIGQEAGKNGMGRNNVAIGNNAGQNHYGEDSVTLGTGANNFLNKKIADGSTITGTNMVRARQTVAIGKDTMTYGENSIAMGVGAKTENLKYGTDTDPKYTTAQSAIAIGSSANAQGYQSMAQGVNAKSQGSSDIAIGSGARTLIIENNGHGSSNIAMGQMP